MPLSFVAALDNPRSSLAELDCQDGNGSSRTRRAIIGETFGALPGPFIETTTCEEEP
jgi:hypothetical protein